MRHFSFAIALSSVILTMGTLGYSVNATTSTSTLETNPHILTNRSNSSIYLAQSTTSLTSIEQTVHTQINDYRTKKGLPKLTLDERISNIARTHSQNMANGTVPFSHNGFSERVKAISTMIPYSSSAENVAYNMGYSDPATKAVQGWLNSTGHRQNIEGNYNLTGIGVAKNAKGQYYFTQIFIRSR